MKGWKGALGGIIAMVGGVGEGLAQFGVSVPVLNDITMALIGIGGGLGIFGIRAKQERDNPHN